MEEQREDDGRRAGGVTAVVAAVIAVGLAFAGFTAYVVHDTGEPAAATTAVAPTPDPEAVALAAPSPPATTLPSTTVPPRPRAASTRTATPAPKAAVAAAVAAAPTAPYAFVQADRGDGTPGRWDPCTPIQVLVNPAAASDPAAAVTLVRQALDRYAQLTGLQFVVDGTTALLPGSTWGTHQTGDASVAAYPHGWAPVLVAWTTPDKTDQLGGTNSGFGGPVMWHDRDGAPITFVSGSVVIDATATAALPLAFGPSTMGALLLHELGHVVGLAHVNDPTQIMNHFVSVGTFGAGDLAGLARLGRDQGCFTPPKAPW